MCSKEDFNYALFEIHSDYNEILQILFNFDGELIPSPSLDIYSYQSFYLKTNIMKDFYFNSVSQNQYTVVLNNTYGHGYICLNQNYNDNNKKLFISEKNNIRNKKYSFL